MAEIVSRERTRRFLFRHFKARSLQTLDELQFYIEEYLGFKVPSQAVCPGHDPPLQLISDLFFEKVSLALGFANRTGGKTTNVAILNHLDMEFKPGVDICVAAATRDQAEKSYTYLQKMYRDPLLKASLKESIQSYTELRNGSVLEIITGTVKGVNSPHPNKARLDEIELMDWEVFNEALSMSVQKGNWRAQDVFTSTRKYAGGIMTRLLTESEERGIKVYKWCIWDVLEQCPRQCKGDPEYGDCRVYEMCQGKAHDCAGWYKIDDFIRKVSSLSKDVFQAQWLNQKPGGGVTIYHPYNPATHRIAPFPIPLDWQTFGGIDFGSNFYYSKAAASPPNEAGLRHHFVFREYFWPAEFDPKTAIGGPRLLEQHAKVIREMEKFRNSEPQYGDPEDKQSCLELFNKYKINVIPAEKDVLLGIDDVQALLEKRSKFTHPVEGWTRDLPLLTVFDGRAPRLDWELQNYSWEMRTDGTPDRDEPDKDSADGAHAVDTVRYLIRSRRLRSDRSQVYRMRSIPGL